MGKEFELIIILVALFFLLGLMPIALLCLIKRVLRNHSKRIIDLYGEYLCVLVITLGFFMMCFSIQFYIHSNFNLTKIFRINIFIIVSLVSTLFILIFKMLNTLSESMYTFRESKKEFEIKRSFFNFIKILFIGSSFGAIVILTNMFYQNTIIINN